MQNLKAAIVLLDSGVDELERQKELAELLNQSDSSLELMKKLRQIPDPIPCLALEICRVFREGGRYSEGQRLLQKSNLPTPCDDQSRRLCVQIQSEIAVCESYLDDSKACPMFADAIRSSIDLLGRTDEDTIQLRVDFAEFLDRSSRYSGALDILSALKDDTKDLLHPWRNRVIQMEEQLRYQKTRKWPRERPMPAEQTMIEGDKENVHQNEPRSPSKKRKLTQEIETQN